MAKRITASGILAVTLFFKAVKEGKWEMQGGVR